MQRSSGMASGPIRDRERRRSLLFDATDFTELTYRDSTAQNSSAIPNAKSLASSSVSIFSNAKSLASNSLTISKTLGAFPSPKSMKRATSVGTVLNAFSKLPPTDQWLRSGIVERQTVSSDMVWLPRLMVLTEGDLIFAKEGSDIVLDRLALQHITFIGKVF